MFKILILLLLSVFVFPEIVNAQVEINGVICDSITKENLPFSTIRIYNSVDSLIQTTISDETGKFSLIKIPIGKYKLVSDFIGFKEKTVNLEIETNKNLTLNTIYLSANPTSINEIKVLGSVSNYSERFNKTIFTPDTSIKKSAVNALDVLKKIATLQVDLVLGEVKIAGQNNTLVLINGRATQSQKPLSTISPDEIEKVEIVSNASKYGSEYSGVVNVILKKEVKTGVSIYTSAGIFTNLNLFNFSIDYTTKKAKFLISTENKYRTLEFTRNEKREYIISNKQFDYNMNENNSKFTKKSNVLLFSNDYNLNENNLVNISYRTDYFKYKSYSLQSIFNNLEEINKNQKLSNDYNGNELMQNLSFFFKRNFKDESGELSSDLNFYQLNSDEKSNYKNEISQSISPENIIYERINKEEDRKQSLNFTIDLTKSVNEKFSFDAGINAYYQKIENTYQPINELQKFDYSEKRFASYCNLYLDTENYSLWGGLRFEYASPEINDSSFTKSQILLPNIGLMKKINNTNKLTLNYNSFVTRPDIWQLNPFIYYSDSLNTSSGNPYLKPSHNNIFEIEHSYSKSNNQITTTAFINWSNDIIDNELLINSKAKTHETYANIMQNITTGLKINFSFLFWKKWNISSNITCYYDKYVNSTTTNEGFAYDFSINSTLDLPKSFSIGIYSFSPFNKKYSSLGYLIGEPRMNQIFIGKNFLKNKAKLYLIAFNILKDNSSNYIFSKNYKSILNQKVNSCSIGFYFTYSVSKGKKSQHQERNYNMENNEKSKY